MTSYPPEQPQYPNAPPVDAGSWGQPAYGSGSAPLAGWWRRVGATLIDGIILGIITALLRTFLNTATYYALSVVVQLVYVVVLIGRPAGQTVGMMTLGTRAIRADGDGPIGYGPAFVRWLVSFLLGVTGIGAVLDVLWPLWDQRNQTLHDKAAKTLVVRIR